MGSYVVVVLTLTRILKSVVTGQAPVTLELRNTPGKKHKPKVVHAYIAGRPGGVSGYPRAWYRSVS